LADEVLRLLVDDLSEQLGREPGIAVIATGGYGRRELAPHSDIDLTVVPADETSTDLDGAIRTLFHDIDWAFTQCLGMPVGYAYRLISDAPGIDAKTRTGLLDMRFVAGTHRLFRDLDGALQNSFAPGEFLLAKIEEREAMFAKHHDTPLVAEPHLKEGAGGLRCMHCANWLREAVGEQPARPTAEFDHVLKIRNLLHRQVGRAQDRLSRQRQVEIAEHLGEDPGELMRRLSECMCTLHRQYLRARERVAETRFTLAPGVLAHQGEARVIGDADAGDAAVGIAIATRLRLRVSDIPAVTGPNLDGPAALFALSKGEATLRNMDRCGLLARLLPELDACRYLMPLDPVHDFTVFEHTLRLVRHLETLNPQSFLGEVKAGVKDLETLYFAALLHDVGKIHGERGHADTGARMAREIGERWGLAPGIVNDVAWLIQEHLSMARVIRIRDIQNPATAREFAGIANTPDRLAMLSLLTWADVCAVHPNAWTPSQDTFLRELYARTLQHLEGQSAPAPDLTQTRQRLLRQLRGVAADENEVRAFVDSLPAQYATSTPSDLVRLHLTFAKKAAGGNPTVEVFHRPDIAATDITVCTLDRPGLLSQILGVLYAFDLSLSSIRACTTTTEPGIAIDSFTVSFGDRVVPPSTLNQCTAQLLAVLRSESSVEDVMTKRGKEPDRKQQLFRFSFHPGPIHPESGQVSPAMLDIRAPRGRGMAYRFSRLFAELGWNIVSARVGQWAGNAAASFYLLGRDNLALTEEEVESALRPLA
jgi:[protein-PII] uridylyltransferase